MRVLKAFVRGFMQPPLDATHFADPVAIIAPAPPPDPVGDFIASMPPEQRVKLDQLLDLALIMRELWLQDASFAGDGGRARSMVLAALLRLFPDRAEPSVADCLSRHCPAGRCADCPADAKTPAVWLDAFLSTLPRPLVICNVPPEDIERLSLELQTAKARLKLAAMTGPAEVRQ